MSCWALVPIKSRTECKGRLAGWLAPSARLDLMRYMVAQVIEALRGARSIDGIAVVTPDRESLPADVLGLEDPGCGLNAALDSGRHELIARGAGELVVLHADLPLIAAADIEMLVTRGRHTGFALASDAACWGTNALYLASPAAFRFHFGMDSRRQHIEEGLRLGLKAELVRTRGLEFDLDRGEDLVELRAQGDARFASLQLAPAGDSWLPQTRFG